MRFVAIKNIEQQSVLDMHRVRRGFVKASAAQVNQIRGLLSEFGLTIPQGIGHIATRVPESVEDANNELPGSFRVLIQRLFDHLKQLEPQVTAPCRHPSRTGFHHLRLWLPTQTHRRRCLREARLHTGRVHG